MDGAQRYSPPRVVTTSASGCTNFGTGPGIVNLWSPSARPTNGSRSWPTLYGVTVVAPVRLDELVLALDVGHVGDEVDAAVGTVVGRAVGKGGTVGHPPPDDALARGECISCAQTRAWVRASDVRAERAVDPFGVVAVVERVDVCRIEAHRRVGMMRRERER